MKLSEAIRKGAEQCVQGSGMYFSGRDGDGKIIACALGAAWIGSGYTNTARCSSYSLSQIWPELQEPYDDTERTLWEGVTRLNDSDWLSYEDIATWLERLGH